MLVVRAATLETDHPRLDLRSRTPLFSAPARRTVVVALDEAGVGGILEGEEGLSTTTTETDIMIHEIVHQTARTGRVVGRLYAEIGTCEMNETLIEETVTTAAFPESTILT